MLNARIHLRWRNSDLMIGVVGAGEDLLYDYDHIGTTAADLAALAEGSHAFAKVLAGAERPMVILGSSATAREDGDAVYAVAARIAQAAMAGKDAAWNAFNVLHTAAGRVGALDLGFVPPADADASAQDLDTVFLLGCDSPAITNLEAGFVIYLGTHGDVGAHKADVILPGATYTEKNATYVNMEGRPQLTAQAAFPPGEAREDWKIIRALSDRVGQTLPYDNLAALRAAMYQAAPHLAEIGQVAAGDPASVAEIAKATSGSLSNEAFVAAIDDFYLSNPVARASAVMAELSALRRSSTKRAEAAE